MLLFCQGEFLMVWVPIFWKKGMSHVVSKGREIDMKLMFWK